MRPTKRTTWFLVFSFVGLAGLQAPGCSNEADDILRNGEDPSRKGECVPAQDDFQPCTLEGCEGQANAHVITAGLPCGLNNELSCTTTGECGGCSTDDQCGTSTECNPWKCNTDGVCKLTPKALGESLQTQTQFDCKRKQCNGLGDEETVNDNSDVPTFECQLTTCVGGSPMSTAAAKGTPCNAGGNSCDGEGNCVQCITDADCGPNGIYCDPKSNTCFTCSDNLKNGDETDVDCGGIRCSRCTQGEGCGIPGDCTTNFCADGVCCDSACNSECEACNLNNPSMGMTVGTCDFIPKYGEDTSYGNGMSCLKANMQACTGAGGCRSALGVTCTSNANCASTKCSSTTMKCVGTTGDSCNQGTECFSGTCTNNMCT